MSNYNYGLEPSVQSSGGSKVRFVLIFILISAVTAALVWWFWPGREELQKEKKPAQSAQGSGKPAAGNSGEKQDPENGADVKKSAVEPRPVETKPADPPKPETPPQADNTKDAGNTAPSPAVDPTDPPVPKKGELTEADKKGVDLPAVPADTPLTQEQQSALERAEQFLASKDYANAEKSALKALAGCAENSAFYRNVWRVLTEVRCSMALYGKKPPYVVRSVIRSGDTLSGIAARYFTTVELLRKKNNISGSRIFVGRAVYAVPGDWKIVVSKKFRLLKLFQVRKDGDKLFAVWEVGIGRMGKTPSAEFAIAARVRHPDWYLADGRVIKYKDPENQLGDYFLKLAPASSPGRPLLGYGIHGARDENTVGRSLSSGCIRMKNKDVEMLYYLVPAGCRVSIVEE